MDPKTYLKDSFLSCKMELTDRQCEQFLSYYEMLVEKNKVMNLTAITEFEDVVWKHFIDSVSPLFVLDLPYQGKQIIDVGTGAGFPGIPLKIMLGDEVNITLMDSLNKRLLFLEEVIKELGLKNIHTVHSRAEDGGHSPLYREQYDYCISRAVANLSTLSEYDLPFVKKGGMLISYKASAARDELDAAVHAIEVLGGKIDLEKDFIEFSIREDMPRTLLMIHKEKATPKKYPRKAGLPSKEPIMALK